jgi:hypothetical protein
MVFEVNGAAAPESGYRHLADKDEVWARPAVASSEHAGE